jgi:hypothetical protein
MIHGGWTMNRSYRQIHGCLQVRTEKKFHVLSKEMLGSDKSNVTWIFKTTEEGNKLVSFVLGIYGIIV